MSRNRGMHIWRAFYICAYKSQECNICMNNYYWFLNYHIYSTHSYLQYVHGPTDVLDMQKTIMYKGNQDNDIVGHLLRIRYDEIVSTDRIRIFGIADRNCRFDYEIPSSLTFYPNGTYTKNLCLLECRIKSAMTLCGCRPFLYKFGEYYTWQFMSIRLMVYEHVQVTIFHIFIV